MRGSIIKRRLDFAFGIPLVGAASVRRLFRRGRPSPEPAVGFIRTAAIGDTVLLCGLLSDALQVWPGRRIKVFLGESNWAMARLLPGNCDCVKISTSNIARSILTIRKHRLDVAVDFGPWPRLDALLATLGGAGLIAGFATRAQYRHFAFDVAISHRSDIHEVENYRRLAAAIGLKSTSVPRISVKRQLQPAIRKPWVALHLWPGGFKSQNRMWPLQHWLTIGRVLSCAGYAIAITGGPSDRSAVFATVEEFRRHIAGIDVYDFSRFQTLEALVGELSTAAGIVSVNTGIMHLAAAVGVRTVALNGPTSTLRWGPLGDNCLSVEPRGGGGGYLNLGFEYSRGVDTDVMRRIHPDDVATALKQMQILS